MPSSKTSVAIDISDIVMGTVETFGYVSINKDTPKIAGILLDITEEASREKKIKRGNKFVMETFEARTLYKIDTASIKGQKNLGIVKVQIPNTKTSVFEQLEGVEEGNVVAFELAKTEKSTNGYMTNFVVAGYKAV